MAGEDLRFRVTVEDPRDRLDKLVVALLGRSGTVVSRAVVQRWIDRGRVTVDGEAAKASAAVAVGAEVAVVPEAAPASTAVADPSIALHVVYEDAHLLVVDKPAGMVVHPARGHATGTMVNALLAREGFAPPPDAGEAGGVRPGIVHRLDKGTSGLLVVAKDEPTREALKALFARHDIEREYVALVVGAARDATYDTLHGRHPTDRLRFTSRVARGKRAVTSVRVLERLGAATLVSCTLTTGRTHQIRVHLAETAKTPVLGDPLYGRAPRDPALREVAQALGHQALHARKLGFVHPTTGQRLIWESPLPGDLASALEALRALATKSSI